MNVSHLSLLDGDNRTGETGDQNQRLLTSGPEHMLTGKPRSHQVVAVLASHGSSNVTLGAPRATAVSKGSLDKGPETAASAFLPLPSGPCLPPCTRRGPRLPLRLCPSSALP